MAASMWSASSAETPTKLEELRAESDGLLKRLLHVRQAFATPKTRPRMFDKQFEKIIAKMVAKFPEMPETDKISGYDALIPKARTIMEDFELAYFALTDAFDWRSRVLPVLVEICAKVFRLNLEENPGLTGLIFDLVVRYCQLHVVLGQLAALDKRATLVVYARMYWHLKSQPEPSFSRTAKWVLETDSPVPRISEDLKACTTTLTNAMREFRAPLSEVSNPLELRKTEALNITLKPALLAAPTNDFLRFELRLAERLRQWVAFGFVAAPSSCAEAGMLEGLLLPVLADGLVLPIAGDVQFALHAEFEGLWGVLKDKEKSSKTSKILAKHKKAIHDALAIATANSPAAHRQRRVYLRQELEALVSLMRDTPALVAPKICVLLAALSLARSEILWYFRHASMAMALLPKKAPKEDWHDARIPELIRLERSLAELILTQRDDVARYYSEYLCGADCSALREALDRIKQIGGPAADAAASAVDGITAFEGNAPSLLSSGADALQRMRRGYAQCEYLLSASQSGLGLVKQPLLVLRVAAQHAEFASQLPQLVDESASLTELWYYRDAVREAFELHLRGEHPEGIASVGTYLQLLAEFPMVATRFWPEERDTAGPECVHLASDFLDKCSGVSRELLVAVATRRQAADRQLRERNAFELHQTHKKDWKPPKDYVPPAIPGGESEYGARSALEQLRIAERNIEQLVHALCNLGTIVVHDTQITPIEYVREMLQVHLTEWLRNAFRVNAEGGMLRPSEIRRHLLVLLDTMSLLEHAGTIGLEQIWREVMLNEFSVRDCCRIGLSEAPPLVEVDFQNRAIGGVISFYGSSFLQRIMPNANGLIVYSPARKGYVSKAMPPDTKADAMPPLKAEDWCDINELRALTSMIGPYGTRVFDTWALRYIRSQLIALKEVLITNALALEEISTCYSRDAKFAEAAKRLNGIDKAVQLSINIGHVLTFRSLLKEALRDVVRENAPYVAATISTAFDSYPRNTFPEPSLLAMDFLACDYGQELGTADQGFKAVLKTIHQEGDQKMWKLLPVLYSVMFLGNTWREAVYIPSLEAYQNNAHILARVACEVIVGFCSLVINPPDEKQVALFLTQFVEISSMVLLRMARNPPKGEKFRPVDFPSIIVFLDRFVENCPLVTRDVLEDCIPYTLLRNMFRDIYASRPNEGWRE